MKRTNTNRIDIEGLVEDQSQPPQRLPTIVEETEADLADSDTDPDAIGNGGLAHSAFSAELTIDM